MEHIDKISKRIMGDVSEIESYLWKVMEEAVKNRDKSRIEKSKKEIDKWAKIAQDLKDAITGLDESQASSQEGHLTIAVKEEPASGRKILELDGKTYPLKFWNELLVKIAGYILENKNELPIIKNFVHKSEKEFSIISKQLKPVDGYYIEVGDSKERLIEKCIMLLEASNIRDFDFFRITAEGDKIKIH